MFESQVFVISVSVCHWNRAGAAKVAFVRSKEILSVHLIADRDCSSPETKSKLVNATY